MQQLIQAVQKKGPVCVGLDTQYSFLPDYIKEKSGTEGEKILAFNRAIIDATEDIAGCFKLQIACYEALGLDGMIAFSKTLQYARSRGNARVPARLDSIYRRRFAYRRGKGYVGVLRIS